MSQGPVCNGGHPRLLLARPGRTRKPRCAFSTAHGGFGQLGVVVIRVEIDEVGHFPFIGSGGARETATGRAAKEISRGYPR